MLLCINRGDFGQSSVRQFGPLEPGNGPMWGVFSECVDDHEMAERVFAALAADLQSRGLTTSDGHFVLYRSTPMESDFPTIMHCKGPKHPQMLELAKRAS